MSRTYVISDVHGHLADLRHVLVQAGLTDDQDRWVGEDAQLWVLGDLVDRGPDGIGVVRLARSLTEQAPGQVQVLMGNHEALAIGFHRFPQTRFADVWLANGGLFSDQEALTDDDVAWMCGRPLLARSGEHLLMHSDSLGYLDWGSSIEEVNATATAMLGRRDAQEHFDFFATLTSRYDFLGKDGPEAVSRMLGTFGGADIVHGHSIIGSLVDLPSSQVDGPLPYAAGQVLAVDGGRYDGGPLLLVELGSTSFSEPPAPSA